MKDAEDHLQQGISVSPVAAAFAGSISGLVARTVTAPLDIMKIRLQLSSQNTTISKVFKSIYRNEGILAFWKGNIPLSFMYIIYGSSQFTSYSVANTTLSEINTSLLNNKLNPTVHSFIVGSTAGMCSTLVSYPFDLLRTKLVSNDLRTFNKVRPIAQEIYNKFGLQGFYKGLKPSLISVTLQMGFMFQTYEFCKDLVRHNQDTTILSIDPFCGLIAGIISKTATFPLDLIRKRLQISDDSHHSTLSVLKKTLKTQGPRGLFSGLSPALLKSGPTSAISLWIYEYSVNQFNKFSTSKF